MRKAIAFGLILATATAAWAHQGVKDPLVMARMEAMSDIAAATKLLGDMAKGAAAFDAAQAREAAATIERLAAETPARFETPADDPKSEARPAIWERFEDFRTKAQALEAAARAAQPLRTEAELKAALAALGAACKACHEDYRE